MGIRNAKPFSLCKTLFITNICRLKEAREKKYICHNVFLTTSFSKSLSHNVFLTMSFWQRLSHNVFFTPLPLHILPHNVGLTASLYTGNPSVLYKYSKISRIRLSSDPRNFDIFCRSNWNLYIAHLQYIFFHCLQF